MKEDYAIAERPKWRRLKTQDFKKADVAIVICVQNGRKVFQNFRGPHALQRLQ